MTDARDIPDTPEAPGAPAVVSETETPVEHPRGEPIDSRFLFVDVAAMRAKQLRRGARPRLALDAPHPLKPERIAMEEVRQGLVQWSLPPFESVVDYR